MTKKTGNDFSPTHIDTNCKACGGTGINSKGSQCDPCEMNGVFIQKFGVEASVWKKVQTLTDEFSGDPCESYLREAWFLMYKGLGGQLDRTAYDRVRKHFVEETKDSSIFGEGDPIEAGLRFESWLLKHYPRENSHVIFLSIDLVTPYT
jgi:hypothetical protein